MPIVFPTEHSQAADFIERALFTYERAFVGAFTFTNGLNRLDFDRVENRPFYLALHRHVMYVRFTRLNLRVLHLPVVATCRDVAFTELHSSSQDSSYRWTLGQIHMGFICTLISWPSRAACTHGFCLSPSCSPPLSLRRRNLRRLNLAKFLSPPCLDGLTLGRLPSSVMRMITLPRCAKSILA
jgi:hypothetical protein